MKDTIIKVYSSGQVFLTNNILGYEGEHISRNIVIKMDNFIGGVALLEIEREINGETKKEILTLDKQGETYVLPIYESLLVANELKMQLVIMVNKEVVFKSETFKLKVGNSINAKDKEFLIEYADKIAEVNKLIEDIKNGNISGGSGSGGGTLIVEFDSLTDEQKESLRGEKGAPFLYEDFTEEQLASLKGKDGRDGVDGKDGTFEDLTDEQKETLRGDKGDKGDTGATGPQGPAGQDGAQGPQGIPGTNGTDGYTPVKGVDYFTEADKQELITSILATFTDAEEVRY